MDPTAAIAAMQDPSNNTPLFGVTDNVPLKIQVNEGVETGLPTISTPE
jgi:hypothetical protein